MRPDFDPGWPAVCWAYAVLWKNGWPVAGEVFKEGTYEIESERRGYALELAVDFVRMEYTRHRFWEKDDTPVVPLKSQMLEDVIETWPQGKIT